MIAQPQVSRTYSPAEYIDLEIASDQRHEYVKGDIVPMTGGTPNHNRVIRNLCTALTVGVRGNPYEVFVADQRLWIPEPQIYTYPDVMIVAGALAYQAGRRDTLTNPMLIVEVLSKSTKNYDRGDKFAAYRTIPTFQEYALVDQYSAHVEHYVKTGNKRWVLQEYDGLDAILSLSSLDLDVLLSDVYDKVQFELVELDSEPEG